MKLKKLIIGIIFSFCLGGLTSCRTNKNIYEDYNGKLSVKGTGLVNQYGEDIRLNGVVFANRTLAEYEPELISNLKTKWNVNVVKVGISYGDPNDKYEKMIKIIDSAIELNMYVVVGFWTPGDITSEVTNEAKDYFTKLSNKYKNINNIIYELGNEPGNSWEEIKIYANTLIDIITARTNKPIILCPTSGHQTLHYPMESRLDYDNTMYVGHVYIGSATDARCVSNAYYAGIPVFISEWSNENDYLEIKNEDTMRFANMLYRYNMSNTFFIYGEALREGSIATVKKGCWDNSLDESTLTDTGKFLRRYMLGEFNKIKFTDEDYVVINSASLDNRMYMWSDDYRIKITSITSVNSLTVPSNAVKVWDITSTSAGTILNYLIDDPDNPGFYKAFIATNGKYVTFDKMFRRFTNFDSLEELDLTYARTTSTSVKKGFEANRKLKRIIGLDKFFLNEITEIDSGFAYLTAIEELHLEGIDFTKVNSYSLGFYSINENANIYVKSLEDARALYAINNKIKINYKSGSNYLLYTE